MLTGILGPTSVPGAPLDSTLSETAPEPLCDPGDIPLKASQTLVSGALNWVLVRGLYISSHNKETILFTKDPHYGNITKIP